MSVAACEECGIVCLTKEAWYRHLEQVHEPRGETVCAICERAVPTAGFQWHPCCALLDARRDA